MHDISSDSENDGDGECSKEIQRKYIDSNDKLKDFGWADLPLRPYQLTGVNWLIECYQKGHGAILGDEMGLGKTCQTIAFLTYIDSRAKKWRPNLIICPRSILENWVSELKRFAPDTEVKSYVGDKDERNAMAQKLRTDVKAGGQPFNVLVTTYELCMKDSGFNGFLSSMDWKAVVVDEAHRLKNSQSLLYKTLNDWSMKHRVLLTGTPVQNNLEELYSLLSFIYPSKFRLSGLDRFLQKFKDIDRSKGVSELHSLLQPYLLRRTKEGVLKDLPKKSEVVLYHGVSKLQKKLYKAILTKDLSVFETRANQAGGGGSPRLMNILMQLRKCVNHPYLFDGVEPEPFVLGDHLVEASGKLVVIDKLLHHLKQTGHKVLLFSQMTHMLDILQDYLGYRDYNYERLDGSVRGEERFLAVQNFNKNEETFVFLLSTKAGGQGLNLVAADTVIFVDSDFNPQNDLQAAARAHRIGQVRPVKIVRLIGTNTVEEIILRRAEDKLRLTEKVIEEGQFTLGAKSLITTDKVGLQDILKFGVDSLLNEEDNDEPEIDFTKILGPSINGEWQPDEEPEAKASSSMDLEVGPASMYEFEGTDYSKEPTADDIKAFEQLLAVEQEILEEDTSAGRLRRGKSTKLLELFPEVKRKPRKPLTAEELEERNAKRKEAAEKRAKLAEEKRIKREEQRIKKREAMWKEAGYISSCVQIESDEEKEEEENGEEEMFDLSQEEDVVEVTKKTAINYVSGDVTRPVKAGTLVNVIVHCADDSGGWGKGGIFSAIERRSTGPQEQYELAGDMGDLDLGDCHLIALDDKHTRDGEEDWLALIIGQHRDKYNNLSGIKLSALQQGLKAVHYLAKARKASVHLPRIGHDTPGFNWYGTERLIKKHLASEGIPTYIYYYPRKQQLLKRKSSEDSDPPAKKKKISSYKENDNKPHTLPDIFRGVTAYLHPTNITPDQIKKYRRYLVAYDADVDSIVGDKTTHVVVHSSCSAEDVKSIGTPKDAVVVSQKWLDDSFSKGRCLPVKQYVIDK